MPDSVAYELYCDCGDTIYAAHHLVNNDGHQSVGTRFWPEIRHPNCHEPITYCANCGADVWDLDERMSN